jgi:2-deoxy-scyllo-inosamine dehydrogenase (SAM-dependent)/8-amino-3,8-dideoxy-alpha-D-manno-octulosonate transaminase
MIPSHIISVSVKGNIIPCFEDYFQKNQMGNINQEHIRDIWNKNEYVQFRESLQKGLRHKYSVCRDCNRTENRLPEL